MVVFVDVTHIVSNQFIPSVVFLLGIGVVKLIEYLVALSAILSALGEEPADANMVAVLDAPLRFNAFRLPTDNDKNRTESWDRMGLRNLTVNAGNWNVEERTGLAHEI